MPRKYVKLRILERGVEAGLSVDDDAVGINEWVWMQQMSVRITDTLLTLVLCWRSVQCHE